MNLNLVKGLFALGAAALIAGCGAGGGGTSDDGDTTGTGSTTSSLTSVNLLRASDGVATTSVSSSQPVRVVIATTSTNLLTVETTVGTLSKSAILPVGGSAEVLLSVSLNDTNDGKITVTASDGSSLTRTFSVGATNLALGSFTGPTFTPRVLALGLTSIAAGGTTQVTANLIDENTTLPYTEPISISFTSSCVTNGKATIDTPVTTVNGQASATYKDINCGASDTITATANAGGQTLTASASLNVLSAAVGSIQFVSAVPVNIALKGTGGDETSDVIFKVVDTNGTPKAGEVVNFTLNTTIGGIALSSASAQTNSTGEARATVSAGTVSTAVRVTATVNGTQLTTQSSQLYVSTGLPEQRRFSISATKLNLEAYNHDGETSIITARLADHFGNPVPDGTAIQFRSERGAITAACFTTAGACSTTFTSQGSRLESDGTTPWNGRDTIVATAVGEENFDDVNPSNGLFDSSEAPRPTAYDLPEAWLDSNENGVRDPGEVYVDFNNNGAYDSSDSLYNGSLCSPSNAASCSSSQKSISVRDDLVLVWSTSGARINVDFTCSPGAEIYTDSNSSGSYDNDEPYVDSNKNGKYDTAPTNQQVTENLVSNNAYTPPTNDPFCQHLSYPNVSPVTVKFEVSDLNGNTMPQGTTIAVSADNGKLTGTSTFTVQNSSGTFFSGSVFLSKDDESSSGFLTVKVTSPKGTITETLIPVFD